MINCIQGKAQIDSEKLVTTCKLHVILDRTSGIIDIEKGINDDSCKVKFLSCSGFKNLLFISIYIDDLETSDSIDISNKMPFTCEYVAGYNINTNTIYHLKGFTRNDFELFYLYEIPFYNKSRRNGKLQDLAMLDQYAIENIDLKCLYSCRIIKKSGEYPCCIQCRRRDERFSITH